MITARPKGENLFWRAFLWLYNPRPIPYKRSMKPYTAIPCRSERFKTVLPPDTLLIIGTDAAGKDYIADFITRTLQAAGHLVEKRQGGFSKPSTDTVTSENKGFLDLFKEKTFLATFRYNQVLLPYMLTGIIRKDLRRFEKSPDKLIVISHTPLRLLAFYLGHRFSEIHRIRIPKPLDRALRSILPVTGAKTIVLDIADHIRKGRIARRMSSGTVDNFDRYMAEDEVRSERIEAFLVWLARKYLNAVVIENNDLEDADLSDAVCAAFSLFRNS